MCIELQYKNVISWNKNSFDTHNNFFKQKNDLFKQLLVLLVLIFN